LPPLFRLPDAPACPQLLSGLKIAITFATIGIIVGEFFTAQAGLGYMILFGVAHVGCR
jgi:NitT/TauT family transport system permease protein